MRRGTDGAPPGRPRVAPARAPVTRSPRSSRRGRGLRPAPPRRGSGHGPRRDGTPGRPGAAPTRRPWRDGAPSARGAPGRTGSAADRSGMRRSPSGSAGAVPRSARDPLVEPAAASGARAASFWRGSRAAAPRARVDRRQVHRLEDERRDASRPGAAVVAGVGEDQLVARPGHGDVEQAPLLRQVRIAVRRRRPRRARPASTADPAEMRTETGPRRDPAGRRPGTRGLSPCGRS